MSPRAVRTRFSSPAFLIIDYQRVRRSLNPSAQAFRADSLTFVVKRVSRRLLYRLPRRTLSVKQIITKLSNKVAGSGTAALSPSPLPAPELPKRARHAV